MNTFLLVNDFVAPIIDLLAVYELPEPGFLGRWGDTISNIALVVVGLGFVIFVHELGHFLAAKAFGVKCDKFYVGFDVPIRLGPIRLPAKLIHFKWGETEYGVGAIPLGGYVKMLGQDDDPRKAEEEAKRIREQADADGVQLTESGLDPRSYPAKPVYARMVIISAGVIMNLIFGAIFAAGAYMWGAPYMPCVVGSVIAGDPAWANGIHPGDRIVAVAASRPKEKELRFEDMRQEVALHGMATPDTPIPLVVERDGKEINFAFKGNLKNDVKPIMTIGILNASTTEVAKDRAFQPGLIYDAENSANAVHLPDISIGEKIVGVNGERLLDFQGQNAPASYELHKRIDSKFSDTIKVTVESVAEKDKAATTREVEWAPVPRRTVGIQYAIGPVVQIQQDSPASQAKVGLSDRPVSLNGQPIVDAATLPLAVAKLAGQSVTLTLKRMQKENEGELYDFQWSVPTDFIFPTTMGGSGMAGYELPGSGLVVSVLREVAGVEEHSSAQAAGLQAGDSLRQIQVIKPEDKKRLDALDKQFAKASILYEEQPLDALHNAVYVNESIQWLPIGTEIKLEYERDGKMATATVQVQSDKQWMSPDRGIVFTPMSETYSEKNVGAAIGMGISEVGDQMKNVVRFLYMLVTNKVQVKMLGGPGVIFYAATQEAAQGPTRLLLFLTMLSANLAIINFLPIPALDGGHMMFLAVEAIRGKPLDENLQMKLTMGGVMALLGLMLFVIVNDVLNLSQLFI
jgi:regulator of sigma E protease